MLASRLDAVFRQDMPVHEVVLLDDGADPLVAAGAADGAARWHRHLRRHAVAHGGWSAMAAAALDTTEGEFLWLPDPDLGPGGDFLRRAHAALAASPAAPFAAIGVQGLAQAGAVLWRRESLSAALAATGAQAGEASLLQDRPGILLRDVALLRLAPTPVPPRETRAPAPNKPRRVRGRGG